MGIEAPGMQQPVQRALPGGDMVNNCRFTATTGAVRPARAMVAPSQGPVATITWPAGIASDPACTPWISPC
jgi:hypothetical protein